MNRFSRILAMWSLALAVLAGCGATPASQAPTQAASSAPTTMPTIAPTQPAEPTEAPTEAATPIAAAALNDSAGRPVNLGGVPQRIVSLAPSITELAFALDLGSRMVAVDDFSNYPADAAGLPKIGGSNGAYNYEQIVALKPDVVLAAGITAPDAVSKLEALNVPVVVIGSPDTTFESILSDITLLGAITGAEDKATALTGSMQARLDTLKATLAKATSTPTVFWELDATDPGKPYTVGPGNFVDDIITLAGGKNIFAGADSPYPQVSAEQIVASDPAIIILADANYGTTPEQVAQRSGWETIAAVREQQVFPIDDDLVSRPGPRVIDGIEAVARLIHPELFR
ncbi:MAG TPA: cobalamin-binding protein [Roseiflexaceae bacterium]|nr:cobalamin-binding protein [Roseiflexaceae bacterium]